MGRQRKRRFDFRAAVRGTGTSSPFCTPRAATPAAHPRLLCELLSTPG